MNQTSNDTLIIIDVIENQINNTLTCDLDNKIDISDHYLYLILNVLIVIAFILPTNKFCLIYINLLLTIAYALQCFWSWNSICGSNLFTWSIVFTMLNAFNSLKILIQRKEVTFAINHLNDAYSSIFEPMGISKNQIKKLFSSELAKIICLEKNEPYSIENITKQDKLSLLLTGRIIVTSGGNILHKIYPMEFLDSPEFQSCKTADEKFKTTITAETDCKILCWQKSTLSYFLGKEQFLAHIFTIILSNDISNKLYLINERIQFDKGNYLDIRKTLYLPSISVDKLISANKSDNDSNNSPSHPFIDNSKN